MSMPSQFDPHAHEAHWREVWESLKVGKPSGSGKPYCIMIPPPNVTGTLHMGHGFQLTLMDLLIRYHRMNGRNTLWQVGTDHAGIATQMVVERQLAAKSISKHDLGRDAFVEEIFKWVEHSGGTITAQMRRMGASVDWDHEAFTLDETRSKAVQKVFIDLYKEGLIYQGYRLVNWDPVLKTALSDLEVSHEEHKGSLWHIFYPLTDNAKEGLIVATTRPETLLGDMAVAVHPKDPRYQSWIGKNLRLPICGRSIPIIADEHVDPEFGSGCVKVTPAHDFNDYAIGKRHGLTPINILHEDATLNENAPKAYQGLDCVEARKQIIEELEALGALIKTEEHSHKVPIGDRTGAVLEPRLTKQWFMKMESLAKDALKVASDGEVSFTPENWINTYNHWLENIEDWCISRQLWWGHRIPAWLDEDGNAYVGTDEADVRKQYNLGDAIKLRQDEDVLDTWFSSALWPFATLGWPEQSERLDTFYPTSTLVTGFDILFFWVARMIMMGRKCTGKIPFDKVYITGLIRDHFGEKMSKSKGNVIDPIDLIDGIDLDALIAKRTQGLMQPEMKSKIIQRTRKAFPNGIESHGTDALRFTYCALASTGRDVNFDTERLMGYRNFCNKLWNATRYTLMQTEAITTPLKTQALSEHPIHRWMLTRLQQSTEKAHKYVEQYRFDLLAQLLYELSWHDFCDWYLELTKPLLQDGDKEQHVYTIVWILDQILRLLHPIMPFITETLWEKISPILGQADAKCLALADFATMDPAHNFTAECDDIEWLKALITQVRTLRSEMNISPAKKLPLLICAYTDTDQARLKTYAPYLEHLARIDAIEYIDPKDLPPSATCLSGTLQCAIALKGLIDPNDEHKRASKQMEKIGKEVKSIEGRLNNPTYLEKAPKEVVEEQQERLQALHAELEKYQAHLVTLKQLMEDA